jgi:hypothetical protein
MTPGYFVYIPGPRGPSAQRWCPDICTDVAGNQRPTLAKHPLTDEEMHLPLNELEKRYPPPEVKT